MKHILLPHHHEHAKKLGIPEPPKEVEISNEDYGKHYADWKRTLPAESHEELHKRVIGHAAWKQHQQTLKAQAEQKEVVVEHRHVFEKGTNWERILLIALALLILLLLAKGKAHAQFSHVNYVQFTGSSGSTISFFTAPFTIQCLSSMTCTPITGGISIAAAAGGTGCTLPGGTNLLLYDTGTLCGDITKWSTNGTTTIIAAATAILDLSAAATFKVPTAAGCAPTVNAVACYDSTAHLWVFGSNGATVDLCPTAGGTAGQVFESNGGTACGGYADPIVSGPDAPGAASTKNPVQVAGNDGTDVRAIATDSSGDTKVTGLGTAGSPSGGVVSVQGVSSGTVLPVSAASLPLPSGAATAAKQPALGTAGSASADVITVQGVASMTKLLVTPDLPTGASTAAKQPALGTAGSASADVISVQGVASMTALKVDGSGVTQPVSAASGSYASGSIADGAEVTLGAKADAKSSATDTTAITIMQVLKEISSLEQAPASRAVTNAGTFEVQPDGTTATTTNAASRCILVSAASTNATNCKNASGNVYGFRFVNTTTTVYYLRMYNASSSPTCSSATGFIESIPIPPATASGAAGGIVSIEPMGEGYSTGIGFCFTGGSSSTDNTNAATGIFGTVLYR